MCLVALVVSLPFLFIYFKGKLSKRAPCEPFTPQGEPPEGSPANNGERRLFGCLGLVGISPRSKPTAGTQARCCKNKNQQRVTLWHLRADVKAPGCALRSLAGSEGAGWATGKPPRAGRVEVPALPSGAALPGGILSSLPSHSCDAGTRELPAPPPRVAVAPPPPQPLLLSVRRIPPRFGTAQRKRLSAARPPPSRPPRRHLLPQPARLPR